MTKRLLALLPLAACFRVHHEPACDETASSVADDEPTPAGTATDLLASVTGEGEAEGLLAGESFVGVHWSVARDDGSAQWVESDETTHAERTWGIGTTTQLNIVACSDRLEVPVRASVTTDGGEADVSVLTVAEAFRPAQGGIDQSVFGAIEYTGATLPPGLAEDPADFHDKEAFVVLDGLGSSVSGEAGWSGTRETEEFVQQASVPAVVFPVPAP